MRPDVQDGIRFAMDLYHSTLDGDALAHRAVLKLAARGVPISPLAVAGATLEILDDNKRNTLYESFIKGFSK